MFVYVYLCFACVCLCLPMFWMPNCIWITHAASVAAAAARGRSRCVAAELAGPHGGAVAASAQDVAAKATAILMASERKADASFVS